MAVATKTVKKVSAASAFKVRGGKLGTIDAVKASLKKGGSGTQFIKTIPANDILTVRFLTEPEEWFGYYEVFDPALGYSKPQVEGQQTETNQNVSFRFLTNALDVEQDRVIPLKLPKDLASRLFAKYEKNDTLTDRDYELSRSGEGKNTTYDYDPGDRSKINLAKYTLLDLGEILESAVADSQGGSTKTPSKTAKARAEVADDEEEEDIPVTKKAAKPKLRRVPEPEPEPEGEDEEELEEDEELEEEGDDEEEDEDPTPEVVADEDDDEFITEADLQTMTLKALRALADEYDVETEGLSKAKLIEAILEAGEE